MNDQEVSLAALPAFAADLLTEIAAAAAHDRATVLALRGDLGAGKTTLVQTLGKILRISEPITSPTFTIMKVYETEHETFSRLVHMDAYRIESLAELEPLRFATVLAQPGTLLCIEWAEKIVEALPTNMLTVSLAVKDAETRIVQVTRA